MKYAYITVAYGTGGVKMKEKLSSRLSFIGAGTGITLFAIFGLLPGAFFGGVLGLNMANLLFGSPLMPTLMPRVIIAVGMLIGVMVTGLMFTVGGASLGWLVGKAAEVLLRQARRPVEEEVRKP